MFLSPPLTIAFWVWSSWARDWGFTRPMIHFHQSQRPHTTSVFNHRHVVQQAHQRMFYLPSFWTRMPLGRIKREMCGVLANRRGLLLLYARSAWSCGPCCWWIHNSWVSVFCLPLTLRFCWYSLDLKELLKKIIAHRTAPVKFNPLTPDTIGSTMEVYMKDIRDAHICDLYQRLGEEALNDPSIPPINSILPGVDTNPTSDSHNQDKFQPTDAKLEEPKAISKWSTPSLKKVSPKVKGKLPDNVLDSSLCL